MPTRTLVCFLILSAGSLVALSSDDWPGWRGPSGDGKITSELKYPTHWSNSEKVLWKVPLAEPGNSSPVVVGERLFLTLASHRGAERSLLCFDTTDGSLLWKKTATTEAGQLTHKTNPYCAASPYCDGKRVYAWFGNAGLHAYDLDGKEIWSTSLGTDFQHQWGPNAASPVMAGTLLIVHAGPGSSVGLFGIDPASGDIRWQNKLAGAESSDLKQFKGSWATPLALGSGASLQILLGLPGAIRAFNPVDGKEIWRCQGLSELAYTNVLTGNGRAVYLSGFGGPGLGMRLPEPDESGDLTETYRLWLDQKDRGRNPQRIGSGQIVGDYLYLLNEPGIAECIEVETGKTQWKERLSGKSWSSVSHINGLLYVNDMKAVTYVVKPDPLRLDLVAENSLDSGQHTNSSPAFAGGRIYFRTDQYLYAVGQN